MKTDPREVIDQSAMTALQMLIIAITIGLNSLDGFDILSISFASPGIAREWGIDLAALGVVLSMELIGMALGSFFLGRMADRIGRRPTILSCLVIMSSGMFMVTRAGSIFILCFWRIITGLGIGGMLAAINALTAEFSSLRRRHLCISLMAIGYPVGGVVMGSIAKMLLIRHDWRSVFYLGSSITAFFIPVFYFIVPESIHWLSHKQPGGALEKINKTLGRLGHAAIEALPEISRSLRKKSVAGVFSSQYLTTTLLLAATYFLHIITFYFTLKWAPKIAVGMGFSDASASGVLVWANLGGALGGIIFGLLTLKLDLKKMSIATLFLSGVFVAVFGQTPANLETMSLLCLMAGFFGNAGVIALYAIVAQAYPTRARAFGTGFMLAIGRGGAVLSPILVGFLLQLKMPLPQVAAIAGVGSLAGATVLCFLKLRSGDSVDNSNADVEENESQIASSTA
jgi:benzoate transport